MRKILVLSLCLFGCSASNKAMVYTENGLNAGAELWDAHYSAVIEGCRAKQLETEEERRGCAGKAIETDEQIGHALETAVAMLRMYWTAKAAGKDPDYMQLMKDIHEILKDLPDEYFGAIKEGRIK